MPVRRENRPFTKEESRMQKNDPQKVKNIAAIVLIVIMCMVIAGLIALIVKTVKNDGTKATEVPSNTSISNNTPNNTDSLIPVETPSPTPKGQEFFTDAPTDEQTAAPTPTNAPATATPTLGPTATPRGDIKVTGTVSVLAAGDNLFHNGILIEAKEKAKALGNGTDFSFDFIYTNVKSRIQAADISVINQESLILPKRYLSNNISRYIRSDGSFVAPEELTQTLIDIGFDVMDKANNHMLDMGSGGMKWGVDYMNTVTGIKAVGAYYDEAGSEQVCVIEKNGVKIAFLAYTYGTNVPQWKASWEAPEFPYYIPLPEDEKMIADLKRADDAADFTVVLIHWGTEQQEKPNDDQRRIAKVLAENGAGIIIGHHPHCLQSIEYVSDGKGGRIICAYSLGTLVSNMSAEKNMLAGFFEFNVNKWSDGSATVSDVRLTPTVFYYDTEYKNSKIYYLSEMTNELCSSHGIKNYPKESENKNKMTRATMIAYLQKTIDNEFLPAEYRK